MGGMGILDLQGDHGSAGWWLPDDRQPVHDKCASLSKQARAQKYLQMQRIVRRFVYRRPSEWAPEIGGIEGPR